METRVNMQKLIILFWHEVASEFRRIFIYLFNMPQDSKKEEKLNWLLVYYICKIHKICQKKIIVFYLSPKLDIIKLFGE